MKAALVGGLFLGIVSCKFPELPPLSDDAAGTRSCTSAGPDRDCPPQLPICVNEVCGGRCVSDADCADRPISEHVCLPGVGACVACDESDRQAEPGTAEDECPVMTAPVCDAITHACRACVSHEECHSGVCDGGRCPAEADVVYMATDGEDEGCGERSSPCLTMQAAIDRAASVGAEYILMRAVPGVSTFATSPADASAVVSEMRLMIVGGGTRLRRGVDGTVLLIEGLSEVRISDLEIRGRSGPNYDTVYCSGSDLKLEGVQVVESAGTGIRLSGCNSEMDRSFVYANRRGGVVVSGGTFRITNSFFVGNGDQFAASIGAFSASTTSSGNLFEFNTLAFNTTQTGSVSGMDCIAADLIARNNIIATVPGQTNLNATTNCSFQYTLLSPGPAPIGAGNMAVPSTDEFMFVGGMDVHIRPGSVAVGKADASRLAAPLLHDFDGDERAAGSATIDVGADEIP